jgi:hypothetical protein
MQFLLPLLGCFALVAGEMCCDTCVQRLTIYANQLVTVDPAVTLAQTVKDQMTGQSLDFEALATKAIDFYNYTYGVDFSSATRNYNNPALPFFMATPGATAVMIALSFNHDKSLNYQVSDVQGGEGAGKFQCAYVSNYEFIVFFNNVGSPFGGAYGASRPLATVQLGSTAAYGYTKLSKNANRVKLFMTCNVQPTTSGPGFGDFSETDTPEFALYVDLESNPDKNWGVGESTKRAVFTPAFGVPGYRKIVSNLDFPAPFYTGSIADDSCIPV